MNWRLIVSVIVVGLTIGLFVGWLLFLSPIEGYFGLRTIIVAMMLVYLNAYIEGE